MFLRTIWGGMLVVEFQVDTPFLREALVAVPGATITLEELYRTEDRGIVHFWLEDCDQQAFEDGLAADPTVTDAVTLAETGARWLYRVACTDYGWQVVTFPSWSELDITFLAATASHEGCDVRLRLPSRTALKEYRAVCAERDLNFQLQSLYEEREAATGADAQLTTDQREALVTAYRLGYFQVPRRASLTEVAEPFDISPQALSERLRRGTSTLVKASLLAGPA